MTNILVVGYRTLSPDDSNNFNILLGGTESVTHSLLLALSSNSDYNITYLASKIKKSYLSKYSEIYSNIECIQYSNNVLIDELNSHKYALVIYCGLLMSGESGYDLLTYLLNNPEQQGIIMTHGFNVTKYHTKLVIDSIRSNNIHYITGYDKEVEYIHKLNNDSDVISIPYPVQDDPNYIGSESELANLIDQKNNSICYLARVVYQKGIENAIVLANKLGYHLDIYGRIQSPSYYSEILNKYPQSSYDYTYQHHLSRSGVSKIIPKYKALIHLPEELEGGSLSIKESVLYGTPVITWESYYDNDIISKISPVYRTGLNLMMIYLEDEYRGEFRLPDNYIKAITNHLNISNVSDRFNEISKIKSVYSQNNFSRIINEIIHQRLDSL